jgi:hypothetical protein
MEGNIMRYVVQKRIVLIQEIEAKSRKEAEKRFDEQQAIKIYQSYNTY